jgi:hypothetical protein
MKKLFRKSMVIDKLAPVIETAVVPRNNIAANHE